MEAIWREHKRFILAVLGAVAAIYLYHSYVIGGLGSSAKEIRETRERQQNELRGLLARGMPEEATVRRARGDVERARESLAGLIQDLSFVSPDAYTPPGGDSKKKHFDNMRVKVLDELQEKAGQRLLVFPATLEFPNLPDDYSDALAAELLVRLAMVEHLAARLIDGLGPNGGKVDAIETLHNAQAEKGAVSVETLFLNRVSVRFRFTADSRTVFSVAHGVQQRGKYLAVEQFDVQRADPTKDVFTADLVVTAIRLNPEGTLEPPKKDDDW